MRALLVIFASLFALNLFAQDYGSVTPEEIKYSQCSFDKDADAVIFFDKAITRPDDDRQLVTKRVIRFKILKEGGLSKANIRILYQSRDEFEKIENIEAFVVNTNAKGEIFTTLADRKSIYHNKFNEYLSEIKIPLPEVKVGSVIQYSYTSIMKHFGGLRDWYFQTDVATITSQLDLTILPGASFAYQVIKSPRLPIDQKTYKDEGRVVFTMHNIAGLREEPYMDAPGDYLQRVVFQLAEYQTYYGSRRKYANTWPDLARDLLMDEDFGKPIEKNLKGSSDIINAAGANAGEYEKMCHIFNYVRKNFGWNGGNSKYAMGGLKKIWENKTGNSGEINLLLINLLKEAKLDAKPLLVSERDHGKVDASYPFLDQFNKVVARVLINGKQYVLDATDEITPPDMIPFDIVNTNGFIIEKKSNAPIRLADDSRIQKSYLGIMASIDEQGVMEGRTSVSSFEYSRLPRVEYFRKKNEKDYINRYFQKEVSNIEIDSFEVSNLDKDSFSFDQRFHFKTSMSASGEYRIVNLNLFGMMEKSPFVSDNRFTNIDFGTQVSNSVTLVLTIPASMKPETLPKNINLVMPDKSISVSRIVEYDASKNTITSRVKYNVLRPVFTAEEYFSVKEFFKKMVDLLNEPLVLKNK